MCYSPLSPESGHRSTVSPVVEGQEKGVGVSAISQMKGPELRFSEDGGDVLNPR